MRRGCARLCSHSGSSLRWEANPGKAGQLVSLRLREELEGRVGSQGREERVRRRRGGVEGPRLPPGPKALLLSKLSDVKENPASRGLRLPWAPPAGELDSGEKRSPLRF